MNKILFSVLLLFLGTSLFAQAPLKRPAKPKQQKAEVTKPKPARQKLQISGTINGHDYVDLGLPSDLKWATCNVGATRPEEFGDYFAWGEIEPKDWYDPSTYKWYNDASSEITNTKYCTDKIWGTVDNLTTLDLSDDAAYVNMGAAWRMPTKNDMYELINHCNWSKTTLNGVNGLKGIGPNGNSIFFPFAGDIFQVKSSLDYNKFNAKYWTSSLYECNPREGIIFKLDCIGTNFLLVTYESRYTGATVRAVVR